MGLRFPRRSIAVAGVERELALLPSLAPLLPVRIPVPVFCGTETEFYPWPFYGAAHLPGDEAQIADEARIRLAAELGAFLRTLHAVETAEAVRGSALPVDPLGRADMGRCVPRTVELLAEIRELSL